MICHFLPVLLLSFSALATKEGKEPHSEDVYSELSYAIDSKSAAKGVASLPTELINEIVYQSENDDGMRLLLSVYPKHYESVQNDIKKIMDKNPAEIIPKIQQAIFEEKTSYDRKFYLYSFITHFESDEEPGVYLNFKKFCDFFKKSVARWMASKDRNFKKFCDFFEEPVARLLAGKDSCDPQTYERTIDKEMEDHSEKFKVPTLSEGDPEAKVYFAKLFRQYVIAYSSFSDAGILSCKVPMEQLKTLTIERQNIADEGVWGLDKNAYMRQEAESIMQDDGFIVRNSEQLLGEESELLPQANSLLHIIFDTGFKIDRDDIEEFYSEDRSNTSGDLDYDSNSLSAVKYLKLLANLFSGLPDETRKTFDTMSIDEKIHIRDFLWGLFVYYPEHGPAGSLFHRRDSLNKSVGESYRILEFGKSQGSSYARLAINALACRDLEWPGHLGGLHVLAAAIARDASGCANNKITEEMQKHTGIGSLVRIYAAKYGNRAIVFTPPLSVSEMCHSGYFSD